MDKINSLMLEVERLELELKKTKSRCNNLEIIARAAHRDKIAAALKLSSKGKLAAKEAKYSKLSNDDVMEKLVSSGYFGNA